MPGVMSTFKQFGDVIVNVDQVCSIRKEDGGVVWIGFSDGRPPISLVETHADDAWRFFTMHAGMTQFQPGGRPAIAADRVI
jgi:hypothetical protein